MKGTREMRKDLLSKLFHNLDIRGFEPDDEDDKDKKSEESEEDEENEEEGEEKEKGENTDALKNALRRERKAAKDATRALKAAQKRLDELDDKEKSESDLAKENASKAESKAQKLAASLKTAAVDNAIIKIGGKLKFRDIDDALKLVSREEMDVEQDEDDPSDIQIDEASIETALKKLARDKPHLIVAEGQGEPSGSKFGGGRKSQKDMDDEALKALYPKAFGNAAAKS